MSVAILKRFNNANKYKQCAYFTQKEGTTENVTRVPWEDYINFIKEYSEFVESKKYDGSHLYEISGEDNEITLRVNFVFNFIETKAKIEKTDYSTILPVIGETIVDTLEVEGNESSCCVCQGKSGKKTVLEFIFPSIRMRKNYFNDVMHGILAERLSESVIKKYLPDFKGDWDTVIQPMNSINHFYGCPYGKDLPVTKFMGIWSSDGTFLDEDLGDIFPVSSNQTLVSHCSNELRTIDTEELSDIIPFVITNIYAQTTTIPKEKDSANPSHFSEISSANEEDMLTNLFPLIPQELFKNPMYQYQIGRCVFNIFKKDRNGIEFLEDSVKENINWRNMWKDYTKNTGVEDFLSIKTIAYFARKYNEEKYEQWHRDWMKDCVEKSYDLVEMHIAEVIYRYFWLDYLTVGKGEWYRISDNGTRLVKCLGNKHFLSRFGEIIEFYSRELKDNADDIGSTLGIGQSEKRMNMTEKTKAIARIINKLGKKSDQKAFEFHCEKRFYREDIEQYFDDNPRLIAWANTVSEVYGNKIYCRPGKMEDFITMNSEIEYHPSRYGMEHPDVEALLLWFKMVFLEEELIEYFLKICASFLYGRNIEKSIYAFCGKGDNSKSMICKLLQKVLSVMAVDFPVAVLTDDRQTGTFGPEVAQAKGARAAFVAEPEDSIPFQGNLAKRLSGGDRIFARKLYENGGSFTPMFKMIIGCNDVPRFENADKAVEDRLKILPFPSRFVDDAPDSLEEQFKQRRFQKDPLFEEKLDDFREPMVWLMCHYFEKYRTEGLKPPQSVIEYNKRYWERNDPYKRFVHENYEYTGEKSDMLPITKTYTAFKTWYMTNMNTKRKGVPEINIFEKHLSSDNLFGDADRRIWRGWRHHICDDGASKKRDDNDGID